MTDTEFQLVMTEFKHYLNSCDKNQLVDLTEVYCEINGRREIEDREIIVVKAMLEYNLEHYSTQRNACDFMNFSPNVSFYLTDRMGEIDKILKKL